MSLHSIQNHRKLFRKFSDLNKYTVYKVSRDFHIKIFKWQIQFLRTSNREDKLRNLIFDTNDKGTQSPFMGFPHIVHQSLKEMDSPVLNDLPVRTFFSYTNGEINFNFNYRKFSK